ncbi:MAG TPA: sugar phosphate isomerase/epimerase family protein, partial [Bryobacteraceae bacterium]|nr:sugar phosphate isomerase/epimerase family protein [Bryobacteraceae bacterium]
TIRSFDDLMKVKGMEPPLPGYKDEDAIAWVVDSIRQCLPAAEKAGVLLALENHWGLTTNVDTLLRIWREVNSPWLGINADTGNYPGDPYEGLAKLAPYASIVQAKTYYGGGVWYTLDLDYKRIAAILRQAGFRGWVSLEMEGNEDAASAVRKSYDMLRSAFA